MNKTDSQGELKSRKWWLAMMRKMSKRMRKTNAVKTHVNENEAKDERSDDGGEYTC